jgi:hypothetical protein
VASEARGRRAVKVTLPIALASRSLRLVIPPRTMPKAAPSQAVPFERHGSSLAVHVSTRRRAVLVLNQAYNPNWHLQMGGGDAPRTAPVTGVTNGFLVDAGTASGAINLDGGDLAPIGAIVSIAALLVIVGALAAWRGRASVQVRASLPVASAPVQVPLKLALAVALASVAVAHFSLAGAVIVLIAAFVWSRWDWALMLGASVALLGAGVFFSSVDRLDLADQTALLLLTGLGLAVGRLLVLERREEVR